MNAQNRCLYEFGSFQLDPAEHTLLHDGKIVPLTPKVFDTLLILIENNGHLVEKDELLERVWKDTIVEEANLAKNISILRKVLSNDGLGDSFIETVPKRGYRFVAPVKQIKNTSSKNLKDQKQTLSKKSHFFSVAVAVVFLSVFLGFIYWYFSGNSEQIKSVVVLPFENKTDNANLDYLADGLTTGLIHRLSKLSQLKVIAEHSSFQYKGKQINPKDVADKLEVEAIVFGKVLQNDENIVVKIEIVEAQKNRQIWSKEYIKDRTNMPRTPIEISQDVLEAFRLPISNTQKKHIAKSLTNNSEALQNYMQGQFYFREIAKDKENIDKSLTHFKKATELDLKFARAFYWLSRIYPLMATNGKLNSEEAERLKNESAEKALELDNTIAEAHLAMGPVKLHKWDFEGAEESYKRAIELSPNLPHAHLDYAGFLTLMGRQTEAMKEYKIGKAIDPDFVDPKIRNVMILWRSRSYEQALEALDDLEKKIPDHVNINFWRGLVYSSMGKYEEAIEQFRFQNSGEKSDLSDSALVGYAYAKWGKRNKAVKYLETMKINKDEFSSEDFALIYIALNEKKRAFQILEDAYQKGDKRLVALKVESGYDEISDEPRFKQLVRKVGLPD